MEHGQRGGLGLEHLTTIDQPDQSKIRQLPSCERDV